MSIEAMNWAYKQDVEMVSKYILVTLSNQADQDGKCWPSINYIAKRTGASRRTVIKHLASLEEKGFIYRVPRPGDGAGRKSNIYHLSMGQSAPRALGTKVQEAHQQSAAQTGQSAPRAPKQSINNQKNNQTTTSNALRFDEWWEVYPKKVERKKTKAIWTRRKLDRLADAIIDDTRTRPTRCARWQAGYAPNPTTYLNGDRWEDEPIKASGAGSPAQVPTDNNHLAAWAVENGRRPARPGESWDEYRRHLEAASRPQEAT